MLKKGHTIDREIGEIIREHNAILREENYAKMKLKINNNKVGIIVQKNFPKGITNSATKCIVKFKYHR